MGLVALMAILGTSCKEDQLEDFKTAAGGTVKLSASTQVGAIVKEVGNVSMDLEVMLSSPSNNAFEIDLRDNQDTIKTLIANGTLKDVAMLPTGTFNFPSVISVPYGVNKTTFKVALSINIIEKNYGKKIAFAIKLATPSKGNLVDNAKETFIVVIDTKTILSETDIHYLTIESGVDGRLLVPSATARNYNVTSAGIVIPIKVALNGTSEGAAFSVKLSLNTDTIKTLVTNGLLPANTVPLVAGTYSLDTLVRFPVNQKEGIFNLTLPMALVDANITKRLAVSVTLSDATRNLIDVNKDNLVILIDPVNISEKDITNDNSVLSVSTENGAGPNGVEGSLKVIDRNPSTKYLADMRPNIWIQLKYPTAVNVKAYTLTTGDDAQDRDPKDWQFEGSNDGANWVILDKRTGINTPNRKEMRRYEFSNANNYTHYRINITALRNGTVFQLSEFRLIKMP